MWRSGDEDGLQSQRSGVQNQVSAKKKTGRVRDRDRVRAGGECVILFEKHPPTHTKKSEKITQFEKKLTSNYKIN